MATPAPEPWLRGPLPGVPAVLMPAAHALQHALEEVPRALHDPVRLTHAELWTRPAGAASAGFHLRHLAGSIDRLLAYARGATLTEAQQAFLWAEGEAHAGPSDLDSLQDLATMAIEDALATIRATDLATLADVRTVGRARLPSSVAGLLFHIAEHTQRHVGQLLTTARVVRAVGTASP